jgi:broad specificity phosphatase PhoE
MLFLVRHGRPRIEVGVAAARWELDPAGFDDIWGLRESGRLPARAAWFSSPEPKALATAQLLTDETVGVIDDLREHIRESADWIDDFDSVVEAAFARPEESAYAGWEPLAACEKRMLRAVRPILHAHAGEDVVLVGHGTAWVVLAAALTGTRPNPDQWRALTMPDVIPVAGL